MHSSNPSNPPSMRDILGARGIIARQLEGYEERAGQIRMAELIAETIAAGEHAIIEAATGIGKSLAYLVPAVYAGGKVIVATAKKNLQDQLYNKDAPFLQAVLDRAFTVAVIKGRANYLCLYAWNQEIGQQKRATPTLEFQRVQDWLDVTSSGDLEELPFALTPELESNITMAADACLGEHCPNVQDCYAEKARAKAAAADIVIVNHTLLLLDCALRWTTNDYAAIVPDRETVIIDEAHGLEEAATRVFQQEVSLLGAIRLLRDRAIKEARIEQARLASVEAAVEQFFAHLASLSEMPQYRLQQPPPHLQRAAENLSLQLHDVARTLEQQRALDESLQQQILVKCSERLHLYGETFANILFPQRGAICYVEKRPGQHRPLVYLRRCPISVAENLRAALFARWPTICCSATLAVGGSFDYFKSRCGINQARTLLIDSPFDYQHNCLIYLPAPAAHFDPTRYYQQGSPAYYDRLAEQIEQLLLASDGRAFCLFTSNLALNEVYNRIAHRLRWLVLRQGALPRAAALEQFKRNGHAVLFATRSFFEGIDVRGSALSLVVIDKIPFGAPDDPIYQARCDEIKVQTRDEYAWFGQLALPQAIITLKQGFGRLIRTKEDCGVVALLDGRVATKRYGGTILSSLPLATRTSSLDTVRVFFAARTGNSTIDNFSVG